MTRQHLGRANAQARKRHVSCHGRQGVRFDQMWGMMIALPTYQAAWVGRELVTVSPAYASECVARALQEHSRSTIAPPVTRCSTVTATLHAT